LPEALSAAYRASSELIPDAIFPHLEVELKLIVEIMLQLVAAEQGTQAIQ